MLMVYMPGMDLDIRQQIMAMHTPQAESGWLRSGSGMTCSLNPFPSLLSSLLRYTTSFTESCKQHTNFPDSWS